MEILNYLIPIAQAHSGEVGNYDGYGHMMFEGMGMGGGGFVSGIFMVLSWVVLIVGVVYLVKHLIQTSGVNKKQEKTPTDILKERYAKGEIDKKEFEEKIREIKKV